MKFYSISILILLFVTSINGLLGDEPAPKNSKNYPRKDQSGSEKSDTTNKTGEEKSKEKKDDTDKPLKIGNLALPSSQQPGPLVGFGQNVIDKDVVQLFLFADHYQRRNGHFTDIVPSVLWGVNDQFSIFFNAPFAPTYKERKNHTSGFEDAFVQFEYAFYNYEKRFYADQATIVFNVTYPTGSTRSQPPRGFGVPSCFIGATYNHTGIDWFYFGSIGSILTSATKHCTKIGSTLLYEFGFGRNIPSPKGWIYAWMIEFDGDFSYRNKIRGVIDPNSGGNLIFVTPSLWISNEKFILQLGVGGPMYQHLYGNQIPYLYQVILNIGYTF